MSVTDIKEIDEEVYRIHIPTGILLEKMEMKGFHDKYISDDTCILYTYKENLLCMICIQKKWDISEMNSLFI